MKKAIWMGVTVLWAMMVSADVPWSVNYQGRLLDNGGNPVNGNVTVQLSIFGSESGGSALFTQDIGTVAVQNGLYSFNFGTNSTPFQNAISGSEAWLEVTIDGGALSPRQRLNSVPYALVAGSVGAANKFQFSNGASLLHNGMDLFLVSADGSVSNQITHNANTPPNAADDSTSTVQDTSVNIYPMNNDIDFDNDEYIIESYTQPASGTVSKPAANYLTFMPASGVTGTVNFTYVLLDSRGARDTGTVTVVVNGIPLYMVIDVSGGSSASTYPVSYLGSEPADLLSNDAWKTTKILLRRIANGTFTQGSPTSEAGRRFDDSDEIQHPVTLTKSFYICVFEVTQAQYANVTGSNPSSSVGTKKPVDQINWNNTRGGTPGGNPDANSFMGRMRTRTGLTVDFPTDSRWEYACRAGTTTALNNGQNLSNPEGADANANLVAWYGSCCGGNSGGTSHEVGMRNPNNWRLFDMHGNIQEWCQDYFWWITSSGAVTDPLYTTPESGRGTQHVLRGSNYIESPENIRSADRWTSYENTTNPAYGFRFVSEVQ